MTIDDETAMAYADGELGPIERKRIERAMAGDPALAERVAALGAFGRRVHGAYAPLADVAVPDRLAALLSSDIVPIDRSPSRRAWMTGLAVAASLVIGVALGTQMRGVESVRTSGGTLVAAGPLARALDTQLASTSGDVRVIASFRAKQGYCRVFASPATDGIACRAGDAWQLRRTQTDGVASSGAYRQASSADAGLMAAAQDMMEVAPLDRASEERARAQGWQ